MARREKTEKNGDWAAGEPKAILNMMPTTYISIFLLFSIIISSLCVLEGLDYQQWPEAFRNFSNTKCLRTPNNCTLHGLWPDNDIGNSSNRVDAPFHNITDQNLIPTLDHLKLVQRWPWAFCFLYSGCQRTPNNFTLHGLWPDNYFVHLSNCAGAAFQDITDQILISRLESSWPDLLELDCKGARGQSFWGQQWEKHGTCSTTPNDYEAYFNLAVDLKNKHDILQTLRQSEIWPGDYYHIDSINSSIARATGSQIQIKCGKIPFHTPVLSEIIICYDPEGTTVIDCPPVPKKGPCWEEEGLVKFLLD
ncbi:unnamed protein product [Fraxinus pennsylvanica]|uniref:Uncharacterized protein n=1 Tax=Fraxinus pennsylvanica TaxID=56036 RepID=A0AAD1ZXI1_9LAMI|nr:unnamed protein product [Fraxinus pennsylvanica]